MKRQLILIALFLIPVLAFCHFEDDAFTVETASILQYETVEQSPSCAIVKITTKDGKIIWNVIAAIGTQFIPEVVEAICTKAGGDPDNCEVVYQASSALVSLGGGSIFRGITKGVRWVAKRLGYAMKSTAAIEAKSYQAAELFKNVFDAYQDAGCMKYETPAVTEGSHPDFTGEFQVKNSYNSSQSDVYLINWTIDYTTYTGVLKLDYSGSGKFRVVFQDPSCNCAKLVEQNMRLQFTSQGIAIRGSNPIDVNTGRSANYYSDNFYITMDYLGNIYVTVIDDGGMGGSAWMKWVGNQSEKRNLLNKFGM